MIRTIQCYDAEKYRQCGNGRVYVKINIENLRDDEIDDLIDETRVKYKAKNNEYRNRIIKSKKHVGNSTKPSTFKLYRNFTDLKLDEGTGNTTFLIGSSKRGKSTLLMYIYDNYYKNSISTLFSINSHIKLYKRKNLINCNKFNDKCATLIKKMKYINHKCDNKYEFTLLFDDITNIRYNNLVNELILTYRNSNISSIVSLQYPNLLSKQARGSINNLLFFGLNNDESIVVALNSFLKSKFSQLGYKKEVDQINLYRQLTNDHQFIYLHPESGHMSLHKLVL